MKRKNWNVKSYGILQHTFGAIANFVVSSRLRFARNIIFNRKSSVPKLATDAKRGNVSKHFRNENIDNNSFYFID